MAARLRLFWWRLAAFLLCFFSLGTILSLRAGAAESTELVVVLGKKAEKRLLPMQDGDVPATWADTALLEDWAGFAPATPMEEGVKRFVAWYRDYYKV